MTDNEASVIDGGSSGCIKDGSHETQSDEGPDNVLAVGKLVKYM